jgi:hypothetical protein
MSSVGDRLVGTFMQPYAEPLSWSEGEETALWAEQSFRKLTRVFNGSLVDRVEKLSEKLNEIISAKRG